MFTLFVFVCVLHVVFLICFCLCTACCVFDLFFVCVLHVVFLICFVCVLHVVFLICFCLCTACCVFDNLNSVIYDMSGFLDLDYSKHYHNIHPV